MVIGGGRNAIPGFPDFCFASLGHVDFGILGFWDRGRPIQSSAVAKGKKALIETGTGLGLALGLALAPGGKVDPG